MPGFVYLTDVAPVAARVRAIRDSGARAADRRLRARDRARSRRDLAAAQDFVISVLGPDGRRQLRAARFGLP